MTRVVRGQRRETRIVTAATELGPAEVLGWRPWLWTLSSVGYKSVSTICRQRPSKMSHALPAG